MQLSRFLLLAYLLGESGLRSGLRTDVDLGEVKIGVGEWWH